MSPQTLQYRLGTPTGDSSIVGLLVCCCVSIGTREDEGEARLVDLRFPWN